jgi:hypothetical protein
MPYAVFPPIGIARIGNSVTDFFVGPERSGSLGVELQADGTERDVESVKDAQHRVKRQAARFQVFEVDDAGVTPPATLPAGATVRWTVRLVNTKDAVVRPGSPPSQPIRPVLAAGAEDRVIDSGHVSVDAGGTASLDGTYRTTQVHLGEVRGDASQRLLVLGGSGRAESPSGAAIGGSFYNNPGWFDDLADGPVTAEVLLEDGTVHACEPAWVVVAPPDFAPGCGGVVTLYDVLVQIGVDLGHVAVPARPEFWRDVQPMIQRASALQWVTNDATWPLVSTDWAALSDPSPAAATLRAENAEFVRSAEALLHQTELRDWQRQYLAAWEAGDFDATPPAAPDPCAELTRGALDGTVGQGFFPGIEAGIIVTDPQLYLQPFRFRFDHATVKAGDLTALMALPWQADFLKCNSGWWPAQRPDVAPQAGGARPPWLRPSMNHARLVRDVMRLGVITPVAGSDSQVEVGRDPTL